MVYVLAAMIGAGMDFLLCTPTPHTHTKVGNELTQILILFKLV